MENESTDSLNQGTEEEKKPLYIVGLRSTKSGCVFYLGMGILRGSQRDGMLRNHICRGICTQETLSRFIQDLWKDGYDYTTEELGIVPDGKAGFAFYKEWKANHPADAAEIERFQKLKTDPEFWGDSSKWYVYTLRDENGPFYVQVSRVSSPDSLKKKLLDSVTYSAENRRNPRKETPMMQHIQTMPKPSEGLTVTLYKEYPDKITAQKGRDEAVKMYQESGHTLFNKIKEKKDYAALWRAKHGIRLPMDEGKNLVYQDPPSNTLTK